MLLSISFISACADYGTFKQDSSILLIQTCSDCSYINLTGITSPDSSLALGETPMVLNGGQYQYTFTNTSQRGIYTVTGRGDDSYSDVWCYTFEINGYGASVSTSQIIGYALMLIITFIILAITIYYATKIPFGNNRDEEGKIISINDFKYVKIVLYVFAYLEFLFIISIAKNMALGFLLSDGIYQFFNILYNFMLIALIPFFPVLIFFTIVIWLSDKKRMQNISRGIFE